MGVSKLVIALSIAAGSLGQSEKSELEVQKEIYKNRWGTEMVLRFDDLPVKGTVAAYRVPYSGYIYPDTAGGTVNALYKYDRAFNRGRGLASGHERWDTASGAEVRSHVRSYGWRGRRSQVYYSRQIPYWHGHCNGWTAAAIRHPEPATSVTVNGVTFTPKDIKSLLAEVYIYSDIDYLAGEYGLVTPDMLHLTMANWLGREKYPIAMEATPGKEKWNYPIYGFAISSAPRGQNKREVKMNIAFANYSNQELDQSPKLKLIKYFHYMLNLNDSGEIVGGYYYRDSSQIDLLWAPLPPIQGGQPGNERGNPHVNVNRVVDLVRQSVPDDLLVKWHNHREVEPDEAVVENTPSEDVEGAEDSLADNSPVDDTLADDTPTEDSLADNHTNAAGESEPADRVAEEGAEEANAPAGTPTDPVTSAAAGSEGE